MSYFCQRRDFYFYNFNVAVVEKFVNNTRIIPSCDVNTKEKPCGYAPSIKADLLVDLDRPYLHIQGRDLTLKKTLMDQTINLCSFARQGGQVGVDIFVKIVFDLLKKNLNFELKCPLKKVTFRAISLSELKENRP